MKSRSEQEIRNECRRRVNSFYRILSKEHRDAYKLPDETPRRHHWWPVSVSKYWGQDKNGKLTSFKVGETLKQRYPKSIGYIENHNTTSKGNKSFENILSRIVESKFKPTLDKLRKISMETEYDTIGIAKSLGRTLMDIDKRNIARYVGSMMVRSPYVRGHHDNLEISGEAQGIWGMGATVGLRASRQMLGKSENVPMNMEEYYNSKDIVLEFSTKMLIPYILQLYYSNVIILMSKPGSDFIFSDAGCFIDNSDEDAFIICPILPNICTMHHCYATSGFLAPVQIASCPINNVNDFNSVMIQRAQKYVFFANRPDDNIIKYISENIGTDFPKPFTKTGNIYHVPRQ